MNTQCTSRLAQVLDAPRIAEINVETWKHTYAGLIHDEFLQKLSVEKRTKDWTDIIAAMNETQQTYVAQTESGTVVGYIGGGVCRHNEKCGEIYALYVDPAWHKKGIGAQLCTRYLRVLQQHWREIWVSVLHGNPAEEFYKKMGAVWQRDSPVVLGEREYIHREYRWILSS